MKKINAFTMAEMVITVIILVILCGLCAAIYKPDVQKTKIMVYAAMYNLMQGNRAIMEKNEDELYEETVGTSPNIMDKYCMHLADAYSLKAEANCRRDAGADVVNIIFPSGTEVKGLATPWIQPANTSDTSVQVDYKVKDILVDVDGFSKGKNAFGKDRFPMRIYNGEGLTGLVQLSNCASDTICDDNGKCITVNNLTVANKSYRSTYCASGINFADSNEIITYDIFRADKEVEDEDDPNATASLVVAGLSQFRADCVANGIMGAGKFNCKNIPIHVKCATSDLCSECQKTTSPAHNYCPNQKVDGTALVQTTAQCEAQRASLNPDDLPCFAVIHKPSGATSFILQTLVGTMDDF